MVEAILMRAYITLYASDFECDDNDDRWPYKSGKSSSSERRAFTLLSSVCCDWYQTLTGWPQSSTPHWLRHKIQKLIERVYILPLYLSLLCLNSINNYKHMLARCYGAAQHCVTFYLIRCMFALVIAKMFKGLTFFFLAQCIA